MLPAGIDLGSIDLSRLSGAAKRRAFRLVRERENRKAQRLLYEIYPDEDVIWDGPSIMKGLIQRGQTLHAREKYQRHLEFFEAGATHRERCAMCANRVGKTFGMGGYEGPLHLTGLYPDWWEGRRFKHPVSMWAAGKTNETTRDIMQPVLLGEVKHRGARKSVDGRGMIPGGLIDLSALTWKQGVQNLVDTVPIKHVSGGWSLLSFKSYIQGRGSFEGEAKHVIWLDEEPPADIYGECLIRTATTDGIVMLTFTPLEGMSEVVMSFLPKEHQFDAA